MGRRASRRIDILLCALASALLLRKSFCGYVCPVGAVSFWLLSGTPVGRHHISSPLGDFDLIPSQVPAAGLLLASDTARRHESLTERYFSVFPLQYMVADTKMLIFFTPPSPSVALVIGLLSWISPVAVRRNPASYAPCHACARACPQGIAEAPKTHVTSPEYNGCQECVTACPQTGCLAVPVGASFGWRLPWWIVGGRGSGGICRDMDTCGKHWILGE
ncbi:MAG: 4Fe-4S binding protein [Desulfovibrio sp.]|nr:4Fe-4S binding protein [Desulfovibrio sp.]